MFRHQSSSNHVMSAMSYSSMSSSYSNQPVNQTEEMDISEPDTQSDYITGNIDPTIESEVANDSPTRFRCALCFFGLPRSYSSIVLPSIEKNILDPNAKYQCDIFVHYFHQTQEAAGRYNNGGSINPDEIFLLKPAVIERFNETLIENASEKNYSRMTLLFANDTNATFYEKRASDLHRYHTTLDSEGNPKYFPWKAPTWQTSSLDNMIRQWHSVEAVFGMMTEYANRHNIEYKRVAMLRNDVCYVTPVDIMKLDGGKFDDKNAFFVIPNFAKWPVNDRMIYGPYEAVKIWATQRFRLMEERVETKPDVGWNMHSERFMKASILPAMKALGYRKSVSSDICFFRTRTKGMLMTSDCFQKGKIRGFIQHQKPNIKKIVEDTVGRNCSNVIIDMENKRFHYMFC
ncbi:unnamed protein product [Cylindrotheca closterium]|uniref:Uncharacterized protein n=1 Tax=Cylindrotheca closterium TaxID=2856 RepID=A0AAD2FD16_9STRA|nr:unnamed protein product [Cylindrotheca closterium]